jgi:CheY-like chemotaxis protein
MTKIMLVEDDNNLREIYEARLAAEGYEIVSAENGEAALAMAAKERPDMIISDVMMPKISGFEMLDILRNTNSLKNVKIIMLTALGQAEDSQRANSLGADRYLVKSQVTLEDIVKATHDLLDDPATMAQMPAADVSADSTDEAPEMSAEEEAVPAPTSEATETAPAAETKPEVAEAPVSPMQVIEPDAPEAQEPVTSQAPTQEQEPPEPAAQQAQSAPVEPEAAVAEAPAADSSQPSSVISIPVSDGGDDQFSDDSATVASADDTGSPAMTVVEPPVTDAQTVADDIPNPDYTSPSNFNNFQVESSNPEAVAPHDEDTAKAHIDNFLNNQGSTTPETETEQPQQESTPETAEPAPEQPENPSVEIPTIISDSESLPQSTVTDAPATSDGPSDPVLAPEQLDTFQAPIISAPEGSVAPEPTSTQITEEPEVAPEQPQPTVNDDQLREAAADLMDGASETPQPPSTESNERVRNNIAPLTSDDPKPDIHQLLAAEEAKNNAQQAAAAQPVPPRPNVSAYNPAAPAAPQAPAPSSSDIDPNSISL